jgi:hypothetical protein
MGCSHGAPNIRIGGSRSKRTQNNEPMVNGQTVEKNEGLLPQMPQMETPDSFRI